jgi:hypothetical protein
MDAINNDVKRCFKEVGFEILSAVIINSSIFWDNVV